MLYEFPDANVVNCSISDSDFRLIMSTAGISSSCTKSTGDMYYVKPYHDLNQNPPIVRDDDCMYKVKPIVKPNMLAESVAEVDYISYRMGNTFGKEARQCLRDQFLSCGSRRKRKTVKLNDRDLQSPGGPHPTTTDPALSTASWTKQEEEDVSLSSNDTSYPRLAAAKIRECLKSEGIMKAEEARVPQQSPKMTAPPPSPTQEISSFDSQLAEHLFLSSKLKEKTTKELDKSSFEGEQQQHVNIQTFNNNNNKANSSTSSLDESNKNSNSSWNGDDEIEKKVQENLPQEWDLPGKKLTNLGKDNKVPLKPKQNDPLQDLENRQDAIIARLHKIQNQLDEMSAHSDSNTSAIEQHSNLPSAKIAFQDLVIGVDPSHVPLSLLVLYQQLSQMFKVKVSVFVHSTVKKLPPPQFQTVLESARPTRQPDDCRTTNDLLLTFIYKQVRQNCSLMINPERQTYIYGEVNVARYLSRLANPDYESDPVTSTQIDHWLDLASVMLWNGNAKAKSQMVQNIDSALSKRKWLVGQNLSFADIVVWSGLHQARMMEKLPSNVQLWRKNCENHSYFTLVNKMLNC